MLKIINSVLLVVITILIGILAYRVLQSPNKVVIDAGPTINNNLPKPKEIDKEPSSNTENTEKQLLSLESSKEQIDKITLDKEQIEYIVKEYITNNPEVIVNAIQIFQKNKEQEVANKVQKYIQDNKADIEGINQNPIMGNVDGEVVIVSFYDYNCGYCKKGNEVLNQILQTNNNVKVILRPFPILGDLSVYIAKVILAVNKIDSRKFVPVHESIMQMKNITKEDIERLLSTNNIDINEINLEIAKPEIQNILDINFELASNLRIQGAPAYIINGKLIPGLIDVEKLQYLIDTTNKLN